MTYDNQHENEIMIVLCPFTNSSNSLRQNYHQQKHQVNNQRQNTINIINSSKQRDRTNNDNSQHKMIISNWRIINIQEEEQHNQQERKKERKIAGKTLKRKTS